MKMNLIPSKIAKHFYGRKLLRKENIFTSIIYTIFVICVSVNLFILLKRSDTIYYLRIYHLVFYNILKLFLGGLWYNA